MGWRSPSLLRVKKVHRVASSRNGIAPVMISGGFAPNCTEGLHRPKGRWLDVLRKGLTCRGRAGKEA